MLRALHGMFCTNTFTRLAYGTFATAYKGFHWETGNLFAIKVIKNKLDTSNKMIERETDILENTNMYVCSSWLALC